MVVVADATPLHYLVLIEQTGILPRLFEKVMVPEAAIAELQHPNAPATVREWLAKPPPKWLEIRAPRTTDPALDFLGAGERDAISLALEANADALLVDERAGRREATRRGLRVIGTLAVLDEAGRRGWIDFPAALSRLRETNFRISPTLLRALTRQT